MFKKLFLLSLIALSVFSLVEDTNGSGGICSFSGVVKTSYYCNTMQSDLIISEVVFDSLPLNKQIEDNSTFIKTFFSGGTIWIVSEIEMGGADLPYTLFWTNKEGIMGATGSTGSTGSTGPMGIQGLQGIQGIQGNDGYNAYQLAQINGFTGSEIEWLGSLIGPTGATGSISLDLSQTGTISIANTLNIPDNDAELSGSGFYIPIASVKDGNTYLDVNGLRNGMIILFIFFLLGYGIYVFFIKKGKTF